LLETDLADEVDIIELTEDEGLECLAEGSFPHPVYCDKYYTCTDQAGELKSEEWQCEAGHLYNPLLLVCQEEDQAVGASLLSRIWISSSVQVTCSLTTSLASQDMTELACSNTGLSQQQREMCEKKHWKQTDHF